MAQRLIRIHGEDEEYYSLDDAADMLNISRTTARRRCKIGVIPTRKHGKRVLVSASFVHQTLKQGWSA